MVVCGDSCRFSTDFKSWNLRAPCFTGFPPVSGVFFVKIKKIKIFVFSHIILILILKDFKVKTEICENCDLAIKIYVIFQHFLFADEWYRCRYPILKQNNFLIFFQIFYWRILHKDCDGQHGENRNLWNLQVGAQNIHHFSAFLICWRLVPVLLPNY